MSGAASTTTYRRSRSSTTPTRLMSCPPATAPPRPTGGSTRTTSSSASRYPRSWYQTWLARTGSGMRVPSSTAPADEHGGHRAGYTRPVVVLRDPVPPKAPPPGPTSEVDGPAEGFAGRLSRRYRAKVEHRHRNRDAANHESRDCQDGYLEAIVRRGWPAGRARPTHPDMVAIWAFIGVDGGGMLAICMRSAITAVL
jgi:hypothetical protein